MSASTSPTLPQAGPSAQFRATSATQYATAFEVSTVPVSPVGFVTVVTLYPNAPWPPGIVLTPQVSGIQGTFTPASLAPSGVRPVDFLFTPTSQGSGVVSAAASFATSSPAPTPNPTPAAAAAFTTSLSASSGTVGNAVTLTVMPTGAAWPSSVVLSPAAAGLSGTFTPTTRTPSGTTAATFDFTPSAAGSGTISVSASPSMTAPAGLAYQATAAATSTPTPSPTPAPTPTPTPAPASTSDSTLANLPSTIVAGQPLSAVTYTPPQTSIYFVLYKVPGAIEEGLRWPSAVMPGALTLLVPQTAGAYTVRGYDAPTAGNKVYESAQINVTAAPGPLPATPAQAADTNRTSSAVTTNWSATAASYHVLARPGIGTVYGSLADATVTTNSYTFTGLAASSSPRAIVIPQNANGYGTLTGQFLSFTTA